MTASVFDKLERLMGLGEPVRVTLFPPHSPYVIVVLTNAVGESIEVDAELDDTETTVWHLVWQIIGCLIESVSHEPAKRGELIEAAKTGLDAVLDVRTLQLGEVRLWNETPTAL